MTQANLSVLAYLIGMARSSPLQSVSISVGIGISFGCRQSAYMRCCGGGKCRSVFIQEVLPLVLYA